MNDIISRAMRGDATPDELEQLARWRDDARENEERYREVVGLLRALGNARPRADGHPPRAADVIERLRQRDGAQAPLARRHGITRWIPWGLAAAAVLVAVVVSARSPAAPIVGGWEPTEIVTGAGELATVHLPDGSVARLAPRSRLRIVPSEEERLVALDGQAFFAVVTQPDRPFRVRTREGDAVALGTRFEVATNARGLRLIVLDGRVALSDSAGASRTEVDGGEAGGVVDGRLARTSVVTDKAAVVAWMGRFLAFQSTPLPSVASEIQRLYGARVVVRDSALLVETVSASFTDEPVRQVAGVICAVIGASCAVSDSLIIIGR